MKKIGCLLIGLFVLLGSLSAKSFTDIWTGYNGEYYESFYMIAFENENDFTNDFVDICIDYYGWDDKKAKSVNNMLGSLSYEKESLSADEVKNGFGYDAMIFVLFTPGSRNITLHKYVIMSEETFTKSIIIEEIY